MSNKLLDEIRVYPSPPSDFAAQRRANMKAHLIEFNRMTVEERLLFLYMRMLRNSGSSVILEGLQGIEIQEIIDATREGRENDGNIIQG